MSPKKRQQAKRRNNFEKSIHNSLRTRSKSGSISFGYEDTKLPYTIRRNYIPDFTVHLPNGKTFYIEAKGFFRIQDMVKMRAVKDDNPDLDIRFVFQADKKAFKGSKMMYSDWAMKYGFPFAIGKAPTEWFSETSNG